MKLSRREFLAYVLASAGTALGAAYMVDRIDEQHRDLRRNAVPTLPITGTPDAAVLAALMGLVDAYVGDDGPINHYETYFNWRAENLPGYLETYRLFAGGVDGMAQEMGGVPFAELDRDARRAIMQRALELPLPDSSLIDPQPPPDTALSAEDELWLRFDRYVIGEMVALYTQTNGWIMLGYTSWPSNARGLDAYPQPNPAPDSQPVGG